jgi:hypothetical protein
MLLVGEFDRHPRRHRLAPQKLVDLRAAHLRRELYFDAPGFLVTPVVTIAGTRQRAGDLGQLVPTAIVAVIARTAADARLAHEQEEIRHALPCDAAAAGLIARAGPVLYGGRSPSGVFDGLSAAVDSPVGFPDREHSLDLPQGHDA